MSSAEDVVELGQEIEVRVDDIDPQGKVSLSLAGDQPVAERAGAGPVGSRSGSSGERGGSAHGGDRSAADGDASNGNQAQQHVRRASFEDEFEAELEATYGSLGPSDSGETRGGAPGGRRDREGGRRPEGGRREGGAGGGPRRRPRGGR